MSTFPFSKNDVASSMVVLIIILSSMVLLLGASYFILRTLGQVAPHSSSLVLEMNNKDTLEIHTVS